MQRGFSLSKKWAKKPAFWVDISKKETFMKSNLRFVLRTLIIVSLSVMAVGTASAQDPVPPTDDDPHAKHLPADDVRSENQAQLTEMETLDVNSLQDGSFEASYGNDTYWLQSSDNF